MLNAAANEQGAKRSEERRNADARDENGVKNADQRTGRNTRQRGYCHWLPGKDQRHKGKTCKIDGGTDGKIDSARSHNEGHGDGNNRQQDEIVDQHADEVRCGQKSGRKRCEQGKTISSADGSAKRAAARRIEMIVVLSRGVVATDDILPVLPT